MVKPYKTNGKKLDYVGNKIFDSIPDVLNKIYSIKEFEERVNSFVKDKYWENISKINHRIFQSSNEFFVNIGSLFTILPLTTRMISSPGAVYGKEAIDYTTDTCPITLKWFESQKVAFLSESSQIYLELSLLQNNVDQVYSIYNSFRKEESDATHLSEFHHIEYEGHVSQVQNQKTAFDLIKKIIQDLLEYNLKDLEVFLSDDDIKELNDMANKENMKIITFKEALNSLYEDTRDKKYKEFTLKHFGSWEEVRITEIYGSLVGIREFPLLEVPFYHALVDDSNPKVADCLDIIWPGYREILGSGHRVRNIEELEEKSKIFNLPREDYKPYLQSRQFDKYKTSSGFGLGWERLVQGVLKMPFIWTASQFPRVDKTLKP
ncbi:MAG: asparagine--tRNA ligase [Candidatus Woesearchaeota archaeon]|jgi:asparaginyl-tRNA synthetase|nr:asparagine--tRNA ligase [Candidatus Woesearchaeota archaeon]